MKRETECVGGITKINQKYVVDEKNSRPEATEKFKKKREREEEKERFVLGH